MAAPTGVMQGNLIPVADSDFETTLTGNWAAANSNTTITARSSFALTGASALQLKATAAGNGSVSYIQIPVNGAQGYTFSGWARSANAGRSVTFAVSWLTAAFVTISTAVSTTVPLIPGQYTPWQLATPAPANAVTAVIGITVSGMTAGDVAQLDTVYAAETLCQVLVSWPGNPLDATPLFADMTPWVRADKPISYSRGRPDETQQVQPGTSTCTFDNTLGYFVPGSAPWPLAVGKRLRYSFADETGGFHVRYDGYINGLVPGWTGPNAAESVVTCTASDLLARLTRAPSMRTMIEQEMLLDAAQCLYTLSDAQGSTSAQDSSGNGAAPLRVLQVGAGGTVAAPVFAGGKGIVGALAPGFAGSSAALQSLLMATDSPVRSFQLQGPLQQPVTVSSGFSLEIWCNVATGTAATGATPICVANSKTGAFLALQFPAPFTDTSGAVIAATVWPPQQALATGAQPVVSGGPVATPSPIQHLMVVVSGTTATLYVNGVTQSGWTVTVPAGFTADTLIVAGAPGNLPAQGHVGSVTTNFAGGVNGSLNLAGVYQSALSSARVAAHFSAGAEQNAGKTIATLAANILAYQGVPSGMISFPSPGVSLADAFELTGQTPMSVLQLYQQVDGGAFYCAAAGQVTFGDRAARAAAVASPALTLAAGQYGEGLTFPLTDQFLINDATFANNNVPGGFRSQNPASIEASGDYPSGDPQSPTTGPWYSLPFDLSQATADTDVLQDATAYQVNVYGTPAPRSPNLVVDLATLPASAFSRAAAYGVDNSSVIVLDGLPATAPSGAPLVNLLMVEQVAESLTRSGGKLAWPLTFNTSPAAASAAWVPGDPVMGVLDSTAIVGRGTDGSPSGGTPPRYVGPPYPVPAFSSSMNRTGNIGANDLRGLWANVQQALTPPVFALQQVSLAQSLAASTTTDIEWDTTWYDTANGFSSAGSMTVYVVQVPGLYKLMAVIPFAANATGDRRAFFAQNGNEVAGRESIITASGTDYVSLLLAATIQCAAGDQLKVSAFQSSGGALGIVTTNGGAIWSGYWRGN